VAGFVGFYQESSWLDFLAAIRPMIDQFLDRFRDIADAGPSEDKEVLLSMITHEESFVHWIEKEIAGEGGSLDAATSQLQYPLSAP
jgi:hypothetical protein